MADDDILTLQIICDLLEDAGFEVCAADNGRQAIDILMATPERFDALVVDRMMPEMGGIEVLKTVRSHDVTSNIPVIFLTAASTPEEMREGIDAGAFYYITKPYDSVTLLAVVRSAISNHKQNQQVMDFVTSDRIMLSCIDLLDSGRFYFSTLPEAKSIVWMLSQFAEDPAEATACLQELLFNAVEHGNLGIEGDLKEKLIHEGKFESEIERRLSLQENAGKRVQVDFKVVDGEIVIEIEDNGDGFDWVSYFKQTPNLENKVQGRGLLIARKMSAYSLVYENGGRRAIVRFNRL